MMRVKSAGGPGADGQAQALLQQHRQLLFAHALAPAGHRGTVERQAVAEKRFAAEQLVIRVLQPALAQLLVGEVAHVLEDGQARHQPGGQRGLAGTITIDRIQTLLNESPVDVLRELHQRVVEINDLIQTRPQPLCLAAVASPGWPHRQDPPWSVSAAADHGRQWRSNFARKPLASAEFWQIRLLAAARIPLATRGFWILHRRRVIPTRIKNHPSAVMKRPSFRIGSQRR
jgi:hypothetical protein